MATNVKKYNGLAHPPLSGKLGGERALRFLKSFFESFERAVRHQTRENKSLTDVKRPSNFARRLRKNYAFTLSEVLITLVIIGVVAALTIPNLMQKYQEQTTVKKVQKFYSNLSNAYSLAMKENGALSDWELTGVTIESAEKLYKILFKPYFKIAKNCEINNTDNCIPNVKYKHLNNGNYSNSNTSYKIVLDDGSTVWFRGSFNSSDNRTAIFYDINGQTEPNQWGKDLFLFAINNDKVFPTGIQSGKYSIYPFNSYCIRTGNGYGCAAWVVYKGNMDYLHCDGLKWTSRSCKDK